MFICHILHVLYCYSTSFFLKCCSIWCTHSSQDRDQRSGVKRSDLEKEICRISWRCFLNEKKATRKMRVGWTSIRSQLLLITPYCYFLLLIHNCNHFINEISPSVFCMFFFFSNIWNIVVESPWIIPLMSLLNQGFFLRRRLDCTMWQGTKFSWEQGTTAVLKWHPKKWTHHLPWKH